MIFYYIFIQKALHTIHHMKVIKNDHYNIILKDIELIKEIFTIFPIIDKIGYCSGGIGWIWYNFWYVRGSYINKVEMPIKTTDVIIMKIIYQERLNDK